MQISRRGYGCAFCFNFFRDSPMFHCDGAGMKILGILLVVSTLSLIANAQPGTSAPNLAGRRSFQEIHNNCAWCHTPSRTATSMPAAHSSNDDHASALCISCHDGVSAESRDDVHDNHASSHDHRGLSCTTCHNPHDRTGSYMALRGKAGPETESSAKLGFCRGCHPDH